MSLEAAPAPGQPRTTPSYALWQAARMGPGPGHKGQNHSYAEESHAEGYTEEGHTESPVSANESSPGTIYSAPDSVKGSVPPRVSRRKIRLT